MGLYLHDMELLSARGEYVRFDTWNAFKRFDGLVYRSDTLLHNATIFFGSFPKGGGSGWISRRLKARFLAQISAVLLQRAAGMAQKWRKKG